MEMHQKRCISFVMMWPENSKGALKMTTTNTISNSKSNPVELAKQKRKALFEFYENIKCGTEIFSAEDLDIAIESMKLAQLDIKERERRRLQEEEAEILKRKLEEDEKRRIAAEKRAAARAAAKRKKHVEEVTAMDLSLDYENSFKEDYRANIHCDNRANPILQSIQEGPK